MQKIQYDAGKVEKKIVKLRMKCIKFHTIYVRFMKIKISRLNTSLRLLEKNAIIESRSRYMLILNGNISRLFRRRGRRQSVT